MDRRPDRRPSGLGQVASDYLFRNLAERGSSQIQEIPVNVYETEGDVVIVAPMPGVEAENIDIEVHGSSVTLRAGMRGPGQQNRRYIVHEWTYGPYERTIQVPIEVDAAGANASHDNGVLVLSLPKAARARAVRVPLRQVTSSEAVHRGHSGHHLGQPGPQDGED